MFVPRIIHQTAPSFDALPADLRANIEHLKRLNPGWEYRFYDDAAIMAHLRKWLRPQTFELVRRVNPNYGVVFADLFRYLTVFHAGGVYLDIKSGVDRPLEQILRPNDHFILSHWPPKGEEFGGRGHADELRNFPRGEFQQWFVIGRPQHPFVSAAAARALTNMARYDAEQHGTGFWGVLRLAGPICYSLAIEPLLNKVPYRQVESGRIGLRYLVYPEKQHRGRNSLHYSTLDEPIMLPAKTG
jgi:mannosyltransferase OCH1-like enzyme